MGDAHFILVHWPLALRPLSAREGLLIFTGLLWCDVAGFSYLVGVQAVGVEFGDLATTSSLNRDVKDLRLDHAAGCTFVHR